MLSVRADRHKQTFPTIHSKAKHDVPVLQPRDPYGPSLGASGLECRGIGEIGLDSSRQSNPRCPYWSSCHGSNGAASDSSRLSRTEGGPEPIFE